MYDVRCYLRSLERSEHARTRGDRPSVFTLRGREWDLLDEVFCPDYSPSSSVSLEFLGCFEDVHLPRRGSMLEVGSGTGVIAVMAALMGCDRVVATDVNERAVLNSAMNAQRHGVAGRVRAVHGDLFDGLDPHERFDLVFWHSNYVLAPDGYQCRTLHDRAYVDPGYATHRRFLAEAPDWTTEQGSVLLHFSSRGDLDALRSIADQCGRDLRPLRRCTVQDGEETVEHLLLEVVRV